MVENQTGQPDQAEPRRYDALAAAEHIPEMVDRIVAAFDPAKIILFGSHARGDAHRWSDVDLLVVFDEAVDIREMTVAIRRVLRDIPAPKDIVVTDTAHLAEHGREIGTVFRPALRTGRVLYERT
ncbi:MAG: nucleotidyltransferase domain-containing protein [Sphaerobacteraceae bacterium]|nr:MAG: nucleotidyltransferase domain-containing protein [Sphaerobacteraceae bacterium]